MTDENLKHNSLGRGSGEITKASLRKTLHSR